MTSLLVLGNMLLFVYSTWSTYQLLWAYHACKPWRVTIAKSYKIQHWVPTGEQGFTWMDSLGSNGHPACFKSLQLALDELNKDQSRYGMLYRILEIEERLCH